ncbi:MAG: permease-like cell division protein FtsX [Bacillota bacterium]|nr:permease-like cell division protein FtsX [Bacillota bacterium]
MAINTKYYTKTALSGMANNGLMTISSVLTISCCLFLFSVFLLFTLNVNYLGDQIKSQCEIQAFIDINLSDEEAQSIYNQIKTAKNVNTATLETKKQAFDNYSKQLGGNSVALEGLEGEDFLRNSVKIKLVDLSLAQKTANEIAKIPGVAEVKNRQEVVDNVINATGFIKNASFISMLILMFVSLFIISNTIKLSVASRSEEIHVMKFVGATNWFIRWPFVIEGIFIGIIGSLISILITSIGYAYLYKSVIGVFDLLKLYSPSDIFLPVSLLVALFGCFMGASASTLSTSRHLKV